jgi:hypothetical protein
MAKFAGAIPTLLIVGAGMLGATCAEVGYTKPGVTEAEYNKDFQECAQIARHQAPRDRPVIDTQWRATVADRQNSRHWDSQDIRPSYGNLVGRYVQVCMKARGYKIAPLKSDGDAGDKPQ